MSDLELITYRPGPGEYAWTFGGAAPVMRIKTPVRARPVHRGLLRGPGPVAPTTWSRRLNITGLNPQTGPF